MAAPGVFPLMAVDIGNSRIKFGDFEHPLDEPVPVPRSAFSVPHAWEDAELERLIGRKPKSISWWIASVNRPAEARLVDWLRARGVAEPRVLFAADLPLVVDVPLPDAVGIDRLADAVAVNKIRTAGRPAIAIDFGSAITVDLVTDRGSFAGGAILPGLGTSARALHTFTDMLPLIEIDEAPDALGTSTEEAMRSGLFWGAVGAVRELVARLASDEDATEVFLTGGGAAPFAAILREQDEHPAQFVPHMTLAGIALAALTAERKR
jgi:type III pantothenate kinase